MKSKLLLLFAFAIWFVPVFAQTDEIVISADRPGMATGTDVMPLGGIQWETGLAFEHLSGSPNTFTLNTSYLRYGLTENAELHIGMDLLHCNGLSSFSPLTIGTKVKVVEGNGWVPALSFMANLTSSHIGSPANTPNFLAPQLYLLFQNDITDWLNIGYNVGSEWDGFSAQPTTFAAVCIGANVTEQVGCFIESYNYFVAGSADCFLDAGVTWTPTRKLQLDLSAAIDLSAPTNYLWTGIGVAWLINK